LRVVIVGQVPYHGAVQAQGLALSVAPGQRKLPPSLRNILKEVAADTGAPPACRDDLSAWARQGVLLLNSALTVEDGAPASHAGRGWEALTDALLARVAAQPEPAVFLEGPPAYYARFGFEAASRYGVWRPSLRIPEEALQVVWLRAWSDELSGTLVYPDPFWELDCVGLR
jgi:hypothetical protein